MKDEPKSYQSYEEAIRNFDPYQNDPRSIHYKRVHKVPKISIIRIALNITIPLVIAVCVFLCLSEVLPPDKNYLLAGSIAFMLVVYILIRMKAGLICLVKIYQRLAPLKVRDRCRFEPSCSEYMIQSIEKYGVCKGVAKGINRVYRCSKGDGGYDYP